DYVPLQDRWQVIDLHQGARDGAGIDSSGDMGPFTELALSGARQAIDRVDDAMVVLLAGRRALVSAIVRLKHDAGIPLRDASREWFVHRRAQRLAARLGVPPRSAAALMTFLIAEACRQQVLM